MWGCEEIERIYKHWERKRQRAERVWMCLARCCCSVRGVDLWPGATCVEFLFNQPCRPVSALARDAGGYSDLAAGAMQRGRIWYCWRLKSVRSNTSKSQLSALWPRVHVKWIPKNSPFLDVYVTNTHTDTIDSAISTSRSAWHNSNWFGNFGPCWWYKISWVHKKSYLCWLNTANGKL